MKQDAIIIGGSYAGLSAALALGRSKRNVYIVDSGLPCNRQTPHSHNFLSRDGIRPAELASIAKAELLRYPTVQWLTDTVISVEGTDGSFTIKTEGGQAITSRKTIFATGVRDIMPNIPGFAECWGISIIHCPFCHGYEVKDEPIAIMADGDHALEMSKLLRHWNPELTVLTNGPSQLTPSQKELLTRNKINIIEEPIKRITHKLGYLEAIEFASFHLKGLKAMYAHPKMEQHCDIPIRLGCKLDDYGKLVTDEFQRTTVAGIFAAGDNATMLRSVANVVSRGQMAGVAIQRELLKPLE